MWKFFLMIEIDMVIYPYTYITGLLYLIIKAFSTCLAVRYSNLVFFNEKIAYPDRDQQN